MAIARIAVRIHSRSRGHSVAAAWAYRSGQFFRCSRTGETHDYRPRWGQRSDEVYRGIAWPRAITSTPAVARDEQTLVDAIEGAERRRDATILRDIQLALADELPIEVLPELVEEKARELADRYHTIAMWAIHPPEPRGERRNIHAHIVLCTRKLDSMGNGFGGKLRILDERRTGAHEIVWMRNRWCELTNGRLARAGSEARIYPGRRLDAPPMPTIPRRYIARAHMRAARRERLAARREGRKAVPIRTRVAELARSGNPANRAMGEIATHVAAGYDVPENERVYETTARTRYERAREYDQATRDAAHYASLPVVREEFAAATAELDSLERRIEVHRAVRETDFARAEPVTPVVVAPLRAPVAPEEDGRERERVFTAKVAPAPALSERAPRADPIVHLATMAVLAPPVSEDDTGDRESGVLPRRTLAIDAADEPAGPQPAALLAVVPIVAPEEDRREREPVFTAKVAPGPSLSERAPRAEPIAPLTTAPVLAPPVIEDDTGDRESGVLPRRTLAIDAADEPAGPQPAALLAVAPIVAPEEDRREREPVFTAKVAPAPSLSERAPRSEPIAPLTTAPVLAPPVIEDDTGDRESVVLPRRALALHGAGEPVDPEPVARLVAAPIVAPAPVEDADLHREPDLEERVKESLLIDDITDQFAQELASVSSDAEVFAHHVEEAMRHHISEAPRPLPCLAEIPRDAEANGLWGSAWRVALDLYEWPSPKDGRERVEHHIERVCARARTDDAWRDRVVRTLAGLVGLRYYIDRGETRIAAREPSEREAREVARARLTDQFAEGGIEAWCEQTIARAAGLEVDWRFGDLTRTRASGLIAEDWLRLSLYPFARSARTLNRGFPQRADERENALTVSEWHGRLGRLVSELRWEVRKPEARRALIDLVVEMMLPDVRLEQMRGGSARETGEQAPPTIAERDQALRTFTRARARTAGLDGELEVAPGRASAARMPADDTREVGPQAPPEPQTANIELEHHRRIVEELEAAQDKAERKAAWAREAYGAEAVDFYVELQRRFDQGEFGPRDQPIERNTIFHSKSRATLLFRDAHGREFDTGPLSLGTLARVRALTDERPPGEIPELEREITREIALAIARVQEHGR